MGEGPEEKGLGLWFGGRELLPNLSKREMGGYEHHFSLSYPVIIQSIPLDKPNRKPYSKRTHRLQESGPQGTERVESGSRRVNGRYPSIGS